jgi:hypothetical protein
MIARVFVPLVGANGDAAQVFEAIAGEVAPDAHPARLLPQISELFDFGLYGIGQTVREAVARFVDARRSRLWLGRRNGRVNDWNLRISDLQVGRLSDENARSAGLGLAIAAICQAFGRDPGIVFATGEIMLPTGPGAPVVAVGPVGGLRGKLMLVGDYIVQHRASLQNMRLTVVLPRASVDGQPLAEAEAQTIERLGAAAREAGAKLDFIFADTLDDLEPDFGPFAMREILTPKRAILASLFVALGASLWAAWAALSHAPIDLAWGVLAPASLTRGIDPNPPDVLPQRARYDASSDKLRLLGACFDAQREPLAIGGETLILRVIARDGLPFASLLRPPRVFVASVSRDADPVILDANRFRTANAKAATEAPIDLTMAVPIESVEDEVRLFVVATRDPTLEISAVQDQLRQRLKGLSGSAVLTTSATFLQDRLGAEIEWQFKVTNNENACPM